MIRFKPLSFLACPLIVLLACSSFADQRTASPKGATVSIIEPADGAVVESPVKVVFGIEKMMVMPAGVPHTDSGHHHLLIDLDKLPALDKPIPADKQHVHFGKGQTETSLELAPGKHTLQLLLGDHYHRPHNPPVMSEKITITVKAKDQKTDSKPDKTTTQQN